MKPARNDPCPCGSQKKYTRCCQGKDEAARAAASAAAQARAASADETTKPKAGTARGLGDDEDPLGTRSPRRVCPVRELQAIARSGDPAVSGRIWIVRYAQ
jgi:hypothetical protein